MAADPTEELAISVLNDYPDFKYRKAFVQIVALLHSIDRVKPYLDLLKKKVNDQLLVVQNAIAVAEDTHGQSLLMRLSGDKDQQLGVALHEVLMSTEAAHGFDVTEYWYLGGVLDSSDFLSMMEKRIAFLDPLVNPRHGAQTHRIQWWIVAQAIDDGKIGSIGLKAADLYAETATPSAQVASSPSSASTLWYRTFDNVQGGTDVGKNTPRCPEWLATYLAKHYPDFLGPAELVAQQWDTAPKGDCNALKTMKVMQLMTGQTQVRRKAF